MLLLLFAPFVNQKITAWGGASYAQGVGFYNGFHLLRCSMRSCLSSGLAGAAAGRPLSARFRVRSAASRGLPGGHGNGLHVAAWPQPGNKPSDLCRNGRGKPALELGQRRAAETGTKD